MKAWLNNRLIDEEEATVSIFDRSYLYGEGVFETLRVYESRPAFFSLHYKRLKKNCRRLGIPLPLSEKKLETTVLRLLKANHLKETVVRITLSTTNISIFCRPIHIDPKLFQRGVKVLPLKSLCNDSPAVAGIKSTSYLTKMLARAEGDHAGAHDALLKNSRGHWVEGSRTNFFIIVKGVVITPPQSDGLLKGITREVVLKILKQKKIKHREAHITDSLLKKADEIFLTGSTSEVLPVREIIGLWKKQIQKKTLTFQIRKYYLTLFQQQVK
ncbi:MAG: aminotransferase class IV [Deltaproteobacteria bacterium]|nr:aminotransferase class IV [Deltaproteobacteria bacterium]